MIAAIAFLAAFAAALVAGFAMRSVVEPRPPDGVGQRSSTSPVAATAMLAGWLSAGLLALATWAWPAPLLAGAGVAAWLFGMLADSRRLPGWLRHAGALAIFAALVVGGIPVFLLRTSLGIDLPAPVLIAILLGIALALRLVSDRVHVPPPHRIEAYAVLLVAPTAIMAAFVPGILDQPPFWWQAGLAALPLALRVLHRPLGSPSLGEAAGLLLGLATGYTVLSTLAFGWLTWPQWVAIGLAALAVELRSKVRR